MTIAATLTPRLAEIDRTLSQLDRELEFLLTVTPIDVPDACRRFRRSTDPEPDFAYRPVDVDEAAATLRRLPAPDTDDLLAGLLEDKRDELATRVAMLRHRGTPAFRELGRELYGVVDPGLAELAHELLTAIPLAGDAARAPGVGAGEIAARAAAEIGRYGLSSDDWRIEVRDDVTGLMVSQGHLLVGCATVLPPERVQALLHHEVGTHVLTHANGGRQPLRIFQDGLAGYEELQEALGVLAEYLSGGLSRPRLRRLAERVVAVASMQAGSSFRATWTTLQDRWGVAPQAAFTVTVRAHRAGGLPKDLVYLRGLRRLLRHLGDGGSFDVLFAGKISLGDVAAVERLVGDGRLVSDWAMPRYLDEPLALERLDRLRAGCDVPGLLV